jgi:TRAP-type uncharacterized transport system fused permease subunit
MMSMVTPPVAIGAYFAASLAGAEPMRTCLSAMRFGWTAYIIPFLFMFSPALLLQSSNVAETTIAIVTAIAGVWLISIGMVGYLFRLLPWWMRVGFFVGGACLLVPDTLGPWARGTDMFGAVLSAAVLAYEFIRRRRHTAARVAPGS